MGAFFEKHCRFPHLHTRVGGLLHHLLLFILKLLECVLLCFLEELFVDFLCSKELLIGLVDFALHRSIACQQELVFFLFLPPSHGIRGIPTSQSLLE